ncbi:MAG: AraC family transcriptional regulator [Spirosomataceae bacterium]
MNSVQHLTKGTTLNLEPGLDAEFISLSGKVPIAPAAHDTVCFWESFELVRIHRPGQAAQLKIQFLTFDEERFEIESLKKYRSLRLLKISISGAWAKEAGLLEPFLQIRSVHDFVSFPSFYKLLDAPLATLLRTADFDPVLHSLRLKSALFYHLSACFELLKSPKVLRNDRLKIEWVVNNYMDHFGQPLPTITELSTQLSMSESKFKYLFKEVYEMPFYQYYQQKRMQQAAEWLKSGELNVTSVSQKLGYCHPIKFIGQFKKLFGITPLQYAKGKE